MNPSSYVLREMKKTNIWPATVGYRPLNDCAAGKKHRTLAFAKVSHLAKCDNFCLTPSPSLFLYILCVSAHVCESVSEDVIFLVCVHKSAFLCVCASFP